MNSIADTWEALCADRSLRDLPYKIETNRYNKIIMSPASSWHGGLQAAICSLLNRLIPEGMVINECPIETTDGVRVPDVAWLSAERRKSYTRSITLPVAPEICVEILSPSNTRGEMLEKMRLYYEAGAKETWLCDEEGKMEFFTAVSAPIPVGGSLLCPAFPKVVRIN
jgi:Uma2 family endonuclease